MSRKPRMSFRDAMALVPDDLPDGAYWAMAHEMAGLDYGDGFDELASERPRAGDRDSLKPHHCTCGRSFRTEQGLRDHRAAKGHGRRS